MTPALALAWAAVAAGPPVVLEPAEPRLGDLVVVYVQSADPVVRRGRVEAFGYAFSLHRVSKDRLRAAVSVPMDIEPGEHELVVLAGGGTIEAEVPVRDRAWRKRRLTVSRRFTKEKSDALKKRLAEERAAVQAVWDRAPTPVLSVGPVRRPVRGPITARFGDQRIFNEKKKSVHYGLDLDGRTGDPVRAVAAGRVVLSADHWYSGGTVILDHGGGLFTQYYHLSERGVGPGDRVAAAEAVGKMGATGRVTGSHLHLALSVRAVYLDGPEKGRARVMYVDPQRFLELSLEGDPEFLNGSTPPAAAAPGR